ncbi:novel hatching enzymes [Pelobates cultripes]|uniref:Metalloendopeptidase n=1 Tax=Pelobates cultripes TaxID=61616 RepID=A0AAD1WW37_PELCU|nr:novel hatching enzymes [Pelobates cultripes]
MQAVIFILEDSENITTNESEEDVFSRILRINEADSQVSLILSAMEEFETMTCAYFVPRAEEFNFIDIQPLNGCWSSIGMVQGGQVISLMIPDCMNKGIVQHELNHALGFQHEQSRSDRDQYVTVLPQNIDPENLHHFEVAETHRLGVEYDFESVMHYSMYAFTNTPGQPTLIPKINTTASIGQRDGLSNLDVRKINLLYHCDICSTLLSGSNGTLTSPGYPSAYRDNTTCVWLIRIPSQKVYLKFESFDVQPSPSCESDYINIYDGASRSSPVLLQRFCGEENPPPLMSSSNVMLVEFISDGNLTGKGFKASYRKG